MCGAVRFEVDGELPPPNACHCSRCRRVSGHFWVSTDVRRDALTVEGEEHVRWYHTADDVRRGFCTTCGSALFWDAMERDTIAIGMGAFETPTGAQLSHHIYVANKGDYYEITDGLPERAH